MTGTAIGLAWRPEVALLVEQQNVRFTEILAENHWNQRELPAPLAVLIDRGTTIIPHGASLSLGGADKPDLFRLEKLARLAEKAKAPYVSEHIAFVRADGYESGHLLPVERTEGMLEIIIENVRIAQEHLPVPLVLENIASLVEWDSSQYSEPEFISLILHETGAGLLLDVANLFANCHNHGWCHNEYLDSLPLERLSYVHVAGGTFLNGAYHDTHAHDLHQGPLQVLRDLCKRVAPPAVLLERDDNFGHAAKILHELTEVNAHAC